MYTEPHITKPYRSLQFHEFVIKLERSTQSIELQTISFWSNEILVFTRLNGVLGIELHFVSMIFYFSFQTGFDRYDLLQWKFISFWRNYHLFDTSLGTNIFANGDYCRKLRFNSLELIRVNQYKVTWTVTYWSPMIASLCNK